MTNILLFIHLIIAVFLILVILMQKTAADGLSGIGSSMGGVVTSRTVANVLVKTTVILSICFFINAILLANLSSKRNAKLIKKFHQSESSLNSEAVVPIAK